MQAATKQDTGRATRPTTDRYAKCIEVSRRTCWDIDRDAQDPRFGEVLNELVTPAQTERGGAALGPIVAHVTQASH
jgi:hypothetical protein